jgi:predicted dehydrogenase
VYRCDNNVVDHQTVSMELESGATAVLFMHGHGHEESRTMRYDGTRATLRGLFRYGLGDRIEIHDHLTGRVEQIDPVAAASGHGGGDSGLMAAFVQAYRAGVRQDAEAQGMGTAMTTARESLQSHLLAFAAEHARLTGRILDMGAYSEQADDQPD